MSLEIMVIGGKISESRKPIGIYLLIGAVVGMGASLIFFFAISSAITAKAVIGIGRIDAPLFCEMGSCAGGSEIPLESPSRLVSALRASYRTREAKLRRLDLPFLYQVEMADEINFLKLDVKAESPDQAREFIQNIFEWVSQRHSRLTERRIIKIREFQRAAQEIRADLTDIATNMEVVPEAVLEGSKGPLSENGEAVESSVSDLFLTVMNPANFVSPTAIESKLLSISVEERGSRTKRLILFLFFGFSVGIITVLSFIGVREFIRQEFR